jgi:hypothetical protein
METSLYKIKTNTRQYYVECIPPEPTNAFAHPYLWTVYVDGDLVGYAPDSDHADVVAHGAVFESRDQCERVDRRRLQPKENWTNARRERARRGEMARRWIYECQGCGMSVQGSAGVAVTCTDCDRAMLAVSPGASRAR